jgi:hypothetical protein
LFLAVGFVCWAMRALKPPIPANSIGGKLLFKWITPSTVASCLESVIVDRVLIIEYITVKMKTVAKVINSGQKQA